MFHALETALLKDKEIVFLTAVHFSLTLVSGSTNQIDLVLLLHSFATQTEFMLSVIF